MSMVDDRPCSRDVDDPERVALIALLQSPPEGLRWHQITDLVIERGSAVRVWEDHHPAMLFGGDDHSDALGRARGDLRRWDAGRYTLHTLFDPTYPEQVRSVRQMPPVLFTEGELYPNERAVSVVGSRKASDDGLKFATRVAERLVELSVTVLAGLAEGIDTAAHRAALDANGRTVAVLGNGLDKFYPRSNTELQQTIARRGMLLSQFLPDFSPTKWTFPARNAVMSAYGVATVVVEAGEHSGTRTQAREAIAHGRPVILSSRVAAITTWGRRLVDQPGVFVADTADEAVEYVERIVSMNNEVARLVSASFV